MNKPANRHCSPYTVSENLRRLTWGLCQITLFRWSPRPCWGLRNWLLRVFGAQISPHVHVHNTARVYFPWKLTIGIHSAIGEEALIYNLGQVTIGEYVTISQRSHLCAGTHDYSSRKMTLIREVIRVEDDAWICADAFIGPRVTVGAGAIVGACAVAMQNVPPWSIVRGNPAVFVKQRPRFDNSANRSVSSRID